jgi:hypothetical protein
MERCGQKGEGGGSPQNDGPSLVFGEQKQPTSKPVPEIIDTVFTKTSPKRSFYMTEYERVGLVFTKTRVYKFGHRPTGNPGGGGGGSQK